MNFIRDANRWLLVVNRDAELQHQISFKSFKTWMLQRSTTRKVSCVEIQCCHFALISESLLLEYLRCVREEYNAVYRVYAFGVFQSSSVWHNPGFTISSASVYVMAYVNSSCRRQKMQSTVTQSNSRIWPKMARIDPRKPLPYRFALLKQVLYPNVTY